MKTTKDINKLERTIEEYRYDRAQAWYKRVMEANGYNIIANVLAFVENTGSQHFVKLRSLTNEDIGRANDEIETLLIKHEEFMQTGHVADLIKPAEIFKWKKREEQNNA